MHPTVGLVEEPKGEGKEGKKIASNNEIHHICMGCENC
jgi:hypothetical protein